MAKNMYQKRKERQDKKISDDNTNVLNKTVINWDIGTYAKTHSNPYKIRILSN